MSENGGVRLGFVIPSVNTVLEPWASRAVPDGIGLHVARMLVAPALTPDTVIEMDRAEGMHAVRQLVSCRPHVIAYGCTASSVVQGLAYDAHLREEIGRESGARATTAAHAILAALETLGARRVSVVSPYTDEIDAMEHRFFAGAGLEIEGGAHLGIADGFALAEPDAEALIELARRGWSPGSEALVMTCLNTRSHLVVDALEREFGKPVVTSTTALLWHALRLGGIRTAVPGFGRLLAEH